MKVTLSNKQFNTIVNLFKHETGIEYPEAKRGLIAYRLLSRLKKLNINTIDEYLLRVSVNKYDNEYQEFIDLLTTNETFFFREKKHFDVLKELILPSLNNQKNVRIWSAACSSGEEAYSLAMVLNEFNGQFDWELLGSDINETMLIKAIAGIYTNKKMESVPFTYIKKYFTSHYTHLKNFLMVNDSIYKKIDFIKINLKKIDQKIGIFDVIFLRNALIYFQQDIKKDIVRNVCNQLRPGGYLVIGHSDSILNCQDHLTRIKQNPGVYQKNMS